MNFSDRVVRFVRRLDEREFYQLVGVAVGVIIILMAFLMYRYYHAATEAQRRMVNLNKNVIKTQKILEDYNSVRAQKNKVDDLIESDRTFRIQSFFRQTLQSTGIGASMSKEPTITRHDLVEGYLERRLEASLQGISMQQLVTLLQKLEENERVYVRMLRIVSTPTHMLDVLLGIATFEPTESIA